MSNPDAISPGPMSPATPELPPVPAPSALAYPAPLSASDTAAYHELRHGSAWFESVDQWSTFRGPKAADALNGLVTNEVTSLAPGQGQYATALTPKGKVLGDMRIFRMDEETFMLALSPTCAPHWLATARKYVNPRLAKVEDAAEQWATWMLYGPQAAETLAALGSADPTIEAPGDAMTPALADWPEWQHGPWHVGPATVRIIRAPLMGATPGFMIMADRRDAESVRAQLEQSGARQGTGAVWDVGQVEAGRPAWGVDMDDNTIPQEANLDTLGAISFTKGCYTGQETVARLHFRGHVNRRLRGLLGATALPRHGQVLDASGKVVGDVRSTVMSPTLGPIAIAMLRREVQEADTVIVEGADGPITAEVRELPFSP